MHPSNFCRPTIVFPFCPHLHPFTTFFSFFPFPSITSPNQFHKLRTIPLQNPKIPIPLESPPPQIQTPRLLHPDLLQKPDHTMIIRRVITHLPHHQHHGDFRRIGHFGGRFFQERVGRVDVLFVGGRGGMCTVFRSEGKETEEE